MGWERFNRGFRLKEGKWSMFNRDRGHTIDDGIGAQAYEYCPAYMIR